MAPDDEIRSLFKRQFASLTVLDFQKKFQALKGGESFVYHVGFLATDRTFKPDLHAIAELALQYATPTGVYVHIRSPDMRTKKDPTGLGIARLLQRRVTMNSFEYRIEKLKL